MLIFLTSLSDEDVEKTLERVRGEIARLGGSTGKTDCMGRRTFARPMKKQDAGVYFEMEFALDPEQVDAFTGRLKLIDEVFRVQVARMEEAADAAADTAAAPIEPTPVAEPTPAEPVVETPAEPVAEQETADSPEVPAASAESTESAQAPAEPEPQAEAAEENKDG